MTRQRTSILAKAAAFLLPAAVALLAAPAPVAGAEPAPRIDDIEAHSVMLRDQVVVDDRLVRLGDLFVNAPATQAEVPVAYAPEPGREAVFDARWLYRVARRYELDWRPLSAKEQATVVRDSLIIGRTEIEEHVRAALVDSGLDPAMGVELSNRMMTLHLPASAGTRVAIENVYHDNRSGRFNALLVAPAGDPHAERVRVTGRVYRTVEVPVIAERMLPGDVIRERDVEWLEVRADNLQRDAIVDIADMLGKTPTRGLSAGQPVRTRDIRDPLLVERGQLVTVYHRNPLMTLTVQGKALQDGSEGDVVRVQNTRSHSMLEAVVSGPGRVVVQPAAQLAMTPERSR